VLKKTITYDDFDGNPKTEDFWFHLTKAELAELFMMKGAGFEEYLKQIAAKNDAKEILPIFKELISLTVGQRDYKNNTFTKTPEYTAQFMSSEAYSEMFMEFMTDATAFVKWVNGVMPKALVEQINFERVLPKQEQEEITTAAFGDNRTKQVEVVPLPKDRTYEEYTEQELVEMPQVLFDRLTGGDVRTMTREQLVMAMQRAARRNETS
jgi:hypothetical protein